MLGNEMSTSVVAVILSFCDSRRSAVAYCCRQFEAVNCTLVPLSGTVAPRFRTGREEHLL